MGGARRNPPGEFHLDPFRQPGNVNWITAGARSARAPRLSPTPKASPRQTDRRFRGNYVVGSGKTRACGTKAASARPADRGVTCERPEEPERQANVCPV